MRDSVWVTRLLAISLVVLAAIILLVGGRDVKNSNQAVNSNFPSDHATWNPARVQYQSEAKPEVKSVGQPEISKPIENQVNSQVVKPKPQPSPQVNTATKPASKPANKPIALPKPTFKTTSAFKNYKPQYTIAWADPSNYGERFTTDANGIPVRNQPIIVLHETSNSAQSAVNTFRTNHTQDENKQVSYHTLIARNGLVVYLVPPDKRAFGAGNSVFENNGIVETVQTNPTLKPSVNNFAYHVSLETPPDAWNLNVPSHSGYTEEQYNSLAWLVAQSDVPDERITTHRAVDRSGQRVDPVSFDFDKFINILHRFRQVVS
jgi:N-acetylmuramoyl-L-alanine amidase